MFKGQPVYNPSTAYTFSSHLTAPTLCQLLLEITGLVADKATCGLDDLQASQLSEMFDRKFEVRKFKANIALNVILNSLSAS